MRVFTPIDDEIMRRSDLSFGAKCTYARLLRYSKGGRCNPSHETLGRELGRSVAQVKKYIRQLEDRGIVIVEKTGRGRGHSSHYVILPPEKVSMMTPQETIRRDKGREKQKKQPKPAPAAPVADDWGKSLTAMRQHYPMITIKTFFRLVNDRAKPAGFTDDELAQGINDHGRNIRIRHPEANPILFGLRVMDEISLQRQFRPKSSTFRDVGAEADSMENGSYYGKSAPRLQRPPNEPSIELSKKGKCPTHKHEVVWTPKQGEYLCVDCHPPPEGLADESKRRVSEWLRNEEQLQEELRSMERDQARIHRADVHQFAKQGHAAVGQTISHYKSTEKIGHQTQPPREPPSSLLFPKLPSVPNRPKIPHCANVEPPV